MTARFPSSSLALPRLTPRVLAVVRRVPMAPSTSAALLLEAVAVDVDVAAVLDEVDV